eukprot:1181199-Prorocentrum_minimum.AAC.1
MLGIYCLPSCDWFLCVVYTVSPPAIGSRKRATLSCRVVGDDVVEKVRKSMNERTNRARALRRFGGACAQGGPQLGRPGVTNSDQ